VICFSWFLLHRFVELRKQVVQKELEKEIQRSQLIAQQKIELEKQVTERTSELNQSLQNLKSTQAQLVQQEKMASLGELTAGIAHEIQNPLNFVNNFSEVNKELLSELKDGIAKGNLDEVKVIASTIIDNEEKIGHHGKRADAIVKGMLQHSQITSGQKEATDINALADEYLRLAYHGMRAKDKSFNATLETHFDLSLGKIEVVPQEIGRVLLNLYNNAFYAVLEKQKQNIPGFEATISVTTRNISPLQGESRGAGAEITVKDNGNGIPEKIRDKIFQPFFTTKPAGEGTGLGLSLAYDIVTKGHGGLLEARTSADGAVFTIQLPFKS
jgi:signal transduction histidine kinase